MRQRRRLAPLLCVAGVIAVASAPASAALPILENPDAIELANKLAEATEDQDICYGWIVNVQDDDRGFSVDRGSSLGPGTDPNDPACAPNVIFVADLRYTSTMSESADSADMRVSTTLPLDLDGGSFRPFGVTGTALLGDKDDVALANAVSALPLLVAEAGLAPPVQPEQTTGTIPSSDRPTGSIRSDNVRQYGTLYALAALLVGLGVCWIAIAAFLRRMEQHPPPAYATRFDRDHNHFDDD